MAGLDMTGFNVDEKSAEAAELEARVSKLKSDLERLNNQLLALTDEYDQKINERRTRYKEKYADRFKDFDYKAALVGMPARWNFAFLGTTYIFELAKGAVSAEVATFLDNPTFTKDGETTNFNPVTPWEAMLLKTLTGVQVPGAQETSLRGKLPYQRLCMIRAWPEITVRGLADKAATFESYLNCRLELELGN